MVALQTCIVISRIPVCGQFNSLWGLSFVVDDVLLMCESGDTQPHSKQKRRKKQMNSLDHIWVLKLLKTKEK